MDVIDVALIAVGVSMDAFAVSVCKGLSLNRVRPEHGFKCGIYFGGFQALMPVIGYYLGTLFADLITAIDHWIAFFLLLFIGGQMILEARKSEELDDKMDVRTMLVLAVATSIDALTVGVTMAFLKVNIWLIITAIGLTTFAFSYVGTMIGSKVGAAYGSKAKITGGIILIALGTKILLEHLGII
ncbi:MAG: manganese efflux pump [Erysipelotrichaceae bacterium]|nr:manganese efflux pump [Erysipelotrichaceae bacterium]